VPDLSCGYHYLDSFAYDLCNAYRLAHYRLDLEMKKRTIGDEFWRKVTSFSGSRFPSPNRCEIAQLYIHLRMHAYTRVKITRSMGRYAGTEYFEDDLDALDELICRNRLIESPPRFFYVEPMGYLEWRNSRH